MSNNENRCKKTNNPTKINGLKYYYTNADLFLNRKDEFLTVCMVHDSGVLMITETYPKKLCYAKAVN